LLIGDDVKLLARLEPVVRRVLIVDGHVAASRLLSELMKGMGAREIVFESDQKATLEVARDFEPTLMFLERSGPRFDGEELVRRLRRSSLSVRQIPIIMVTAEATASTIKGARDAGVHEFMIKPFTTGDLVRRVVNVATKPRPWVEAMGYVGPDRRRFNSGEFKGARKRQSELRAVAGSATEDMDRAGKIILSALNQFDDDPPQARRALAAQGELLKALAISAGRSRLAGAAAELITASQKASDGVDAVRGQAVAVLALLSEGRDGTAAA